MSSTMIVGVGGHFINVADISTVAPERYDGEVRGCKVTFMSKTTYLIFPDLTPEQFMDALVSGTVKLALPN